MEAERILKEVSEFNKKEPLNEPLLVTAIADGAPTASFRDLFRDGRMTHLTIILWIAWLVSSRCLAAYSRLDIFCCATLRAKHKRSVTRSMLQSGGLLT